MARRVALFTAVICGAVSTGAFLLFPELLVGLFLPLDNAAARIAVGGFPYYGCGFIFFVLNLAVIGYYQSIEKVKPSTLFALLRGFLFLVPCFLLLPRWLGERGIWLALSCAECVTTLFRRVVWLPRRRSAGLPKRP